MPSAFLLVVACILFGFPPMPRAATPAYRVTRTVSLGMPDRWDYVTFDAASRRVLIAHGNHTDVVDAVSGRVLGKLDGLHGAHGQIAVGGRIFADSGETAAITIFDTHAMRAIRSGPAGADADGVIYEPKHRLVVVLDGDAGAATLIDSATGTVRATVALGGSPEFAAADGAGHIYVNIASTGEIAVVDAAAARVTARFPLPGCYSPHGLAIDPKTMRLFTSCLNARLMVVDAAGGRVLQTLPIGRGSDAVAFDPVRRLVFSSNNDGTLSVMREQADGAVLPLGNVRTAAGARTLALDPANGRVFLVTADVTGPLPPVHGGKVPKYAFRPGSVKLLFLDPVRSGS